MAEKARHAFGRSEGIDAALQAGVIDSYDILFLDGDTDNPKVGWIDKNGNKIICRDTDVNELKAEIATKATAEDVEEVKADVATKATTKEVESKVEAATSEAIISAATYTDNKLEITEKIKYEISNVPVGTLVDYRDKEIRVMCPIGTKFVQQTVGSTGNANMYYMAFKAYAPDAAVSFKEGDRGVIVDEMFTFDSEFAGTDKYGRKYSVCWLALASCDVTTGEWTYFGKNSNSEKYLGWDYVVEWYNEAGIVIAADAIRINLTNEDCHATIEPSYVAKVAAEAKAYTDEQIANVSVAVQVIEF